eukprot:1149720-Prymnesium_polylepis.1
MCSAAESFCDWKLRGSCSARLQRNSNCHVREQQSILARSSVLPGGPVQCYVTSGPWSSTSRHYVTALTARRQRTGNASDIPPQRERLDTHVHTSVQCSRCVCAAWACCIGVLCLVLLRDPSCEKTFLHARSSTHGERANRRRCRTPP